jgi:hypothetical protein
MEYGLPNYMLFSIHAFPRTYLGTFLSHTGKTTYRTTANSDKAIPVTGRGGR